MSDLPITTYPPSTGGAAASASIDADYVADFVAGVAWFEAIPGFLPAGTTIIVYAADPGDPTPIVPGLYTGNGVDAWTYTMDLWDGSHEHRLVNVGTRLPSPSPPTMPGPWLYEVFSDTPSSFPAGLIAGQPPTLFVAEVADGNGWGGGAAIWRRSGRFSVEGTVTVGTTDVDTVINDTTIDAEAGVLPAVDTPVQALALSPDGFSLAVFILTTTGDLQVAQLDPDATSVIFGDGSWSL